MSSGLLGRFDVVKSSIGWTMPRPIRYAHMRLAKACWNHSFDFEVIHFASSVRRSIPGTSFSVLPSRSFALGELERHARARSSA